MACSPFKFHVLVERTYTLLMMCKTHFFSQSLFVKYLYASNIYLNNTNACIDTCHISRMIPDHIPGRKKCIASIHRRELSSAVRYEIIEQLFPVPWPVARNWRRAGCVRPNGAEIIIISFCNQDLFVIYLKPLRCM